jgi:hypothetical protein
MEFKAESRVNRRGTQEESLLLSKFIHFCPEASPVGSKD